MYRAALEALPLPGGGTACSQEGSAAFALLIPPTASVQSGDLGCWHGLASQAVFDVERGLPDSAVVARIVCAFQPEAAVESVRSSSTPFGRLLLPGSHLVDEAAVGLLQLLELPDSPLSGLPAGPRAVVARLGAMLWLAGEMLLSPRSLYTASSDSASGSGKTGCTSICAMPAGPRAVVARLGAMLWLAGEMLLSPRSLYTASSDSASGSGKTGCTSICAMPAGPRAVVA
eukprot:CAMPEP_0178404104 /NCGR_PEP_ID=MMETSP0689_2-20121128/17708_1 /TAXON_ID=160604 /ORGANISM="Amphidinium massartii, Strain CS-259" /LENGTH=229 /DNA_ID=CAMNT_0020025071 /DNA_START=124 /DNA_END=811 /DNA_ORIENTATION=-